MNNYQKPTDDVFAPKVEVWDEVVLEDLEAQRLIDFAIEEGKLPW